MPASSGPLKRPAKCPSRAAFLCIGAALTLALCKCSVLVGDGRYSFTPSAAAGNGGELAGSDGSRRDSGAGSDDRTLSDARGGSGSSNGGSNGVSNSGGSQQSSSGEGGVPAIGAGGGGGASAAAGGTSAAAGGTSAAAGGTSAAAGGTSAAAGGASAAAGGASAGSAPVCSNCLQVYYENTASAETTEEVEIHFALRNAGVTAIDLSMVRVRYYFTADGCSFSGWQGRCDSSLMNLNATACPSLVVTAMVKVEPTADSYAELTWLGAGTLPASSSLTYEYIGAFYRSAYDCTFHQANDYSYTPNTPKFVATQSMTAYLGGTLVWGTEP